MLSVLKVLLFSGVVLGQDDISFLGGSNFVLSYGGMKNMLNERHDKAAKLVSQSSYASVIEHNEDLGLELLQEACNLEYGRACWYYAYETEDEEDILRAQEVLQKSCFSPSANKYNGESCTYLGIMVSHNKADIAESEQEIYTRACNLGDGWGCYRLAKEFIIDEDIEKAKEIEEKALSILLQDCGKSEAASCYFAGSMYAEKGSEDDIVKAHEFYEKGCNLGDGDSCYELQRFRK
mgnify:FL=1